MSVQRRRLKQDLLHVLARCPVCFEDYSSQRPPATFPCGHNLCVECVHELRRSNEYVRCPQDNKKQRLGQVSANRSLLKLLQTARSNLAENVDKGVYCSDCDLQAENEAQTAQLHQEVEQLQTWVEHLQSTFPTELYYCTMFAWIEEEFKSLNEYTL